MLAETGSQYHGGDPLSCCRLPGRPMDNPCGRSTCDDCPTRVVCRCLQITEQVLVEALTRQDVRSVRDIRRHTGAGDGCTACHRHLQRYLERYASSSASPICSVK